MKKLICLLLAFTLVFSLCACGKNDVVDNKDGTSNVQDTTDIIPSEDNEANEPETDSDIDDEYIENEDIGYKVGDYITFGSYEQDNNLSNGKEDIEWLILDVQGDRLFVISKYALDCKPYNDEWVNVTWEDCTLRQWLNYDFWNSAFSSYEQGQILTTSVVAEDNRYYGTDAGNVTQDKVFLLSINETDNYFVSCDSLRCIYTAYAVAMGCRPGGAGTYYYNNCCWWLRTPGNDGNDAVKIARDGVVGAMGDCVDWDGNGIRPAMWIEIG